MTEDRSQWRPFVEQVCTELELDAERVDIDGILDMTRVIARAGRRPMAPVSAYLLGLAVGGSPEKSFEQLRQILSDEALAAPPPGSNPM